MIHPLFGLVMTLAVQTFYVSPIGTETGNGSQARPFRTLAQACRALPANKAAVLMLAPGTYTETDTVKLPSQITLKGAGVGKTTISGQKSPIFSVENAKQVSISRIKFDGSLLGDPTKGHTQIINCKNVDGFQLFSVRFENCTNGALFYTSKNISIHDFTGTNACVGTQDTFSFVTSAENVEIYNGDLFNDDDHGGKCVGTSPDQSLNPTAPWNLPLAKIKNFRVHDVRQFTAAQGRWVIPGTNVYPPQICIEFWHSELENIEVDHCEFNNTVSCASEPNPKAATPLRLHHSRWTKCRGYAIEVVCNGMEIDHNWIEGGSYPIAEFGNRPIDRLNVHHNVFEKQGFPTLVMHVMAGVTRLSFKNNTVIANTARNLFYLGPKRVGERDNEIIANIFYYQGEKIDGVDVPGDIANNAFFNLTPKGTYAFNADPKLSLTAPFYVLQPGSPAIGAGVKTMARYGNDADLGAFPFGKKPWTAGVRWKSILN